MTRLQALYKVVDQTSPEIFDLYDWGTCFAAAAVAHGPFFDMGLIMNDEGVPAFSCDDENYEGFEALCKFFGLLKREALYLFAESYYDPNGYSDTDKLITIPLTCYSAHALFLTRLKSVIQARRENYGHPPSK